jgi:hypothetical protein
LLTTVCLLYLCKCAADDGVLSAGGARRRSMRRTGIGPMAGIGEETEAECAVCGRWPSTLRPAMRNAIDRLPFRKPVCEGCMVALARNSWRLVIEPEPKPKPKC